MAYKIDFTASHYVARARRKAFLRFLLLAAIGCAAWGVYDVYTTYNKPTLNMKLAGYEAASRPIEEMNTAWDEASREYNAMLKYYRLLWAANPTNYLVAMAAPEAPRLGRGFRPANWTLTTGGACRLDYVYGFNPGDKAEQARGLESAMVHAVTSVVAVAGGKVEVRGIQLENLLNVDELNLSVAFSLPDVKPFPGKESALADCVSEIKAFRKKVQGSKVVKDGGAKGAPTEVQEIMMQYLPREFGKNKPEFPVMTNVINVSGWIDRADQFIARNNIPGNAQERRTLKENWNRVGNARFPWQRFRALDNDQLVARTKVLETVSDGVKRFKVFLDQRHVDCRRKLEPFVEAYEHNDVFNKPLVESDLKDRVAGLLGIGRVRTAFKDEPQKEVAELVKEDEKFTFTWVRWTLSLGDGAGREGEHDQQSADSAQEAPLTLAKIADCARKVQELGPGYALDTVKVMFGADGAVSGAVFEGLLPVKKSVALKEAKKDVN